MSYLKRKVKLGFLMMAFLAACLLAFLYDWGFLATCRFRVLFS